MLESLRGRKTFKIRKREFSRLCFRFFVILSFLHYHKWKFIGFRWDRAHDGVSLTTFMLAFISMFSIFMNYACTYIGNGSCCRCPFMWISPILPPPKFIWSLSDSMNFRFALCFLSAFGSKWDCVHIQRKPLMIYGWFNLSGNEYWRDSKFKWKNSRFAISIMKKCLWLICICPYKRKRDERKGRRDGESM